MNMGSIEIGIKVFKHRLVMAIRDGVLAAVNSPDSVSAATGIPVQELGIISDLREDQRTALAKIISGAIDVGIDHFLYGLDNQPEGLRVFYFEVQLNEEGMLLLSDGKPQLSDMSRYDQDGLPKEEK
jgi:hypothetical protein